MEMGKCLLAVISMLALVGFCEEVETVKVRGRGVGVSRLEALKDAYRDAVEQAVGLYVDAEQMVRNESLVKDQILTQSNAYIENYKIAKEGRSEDGQVSVTILAEVRRLALTRRIRNVMLVQKSELSAVSKKLHAEIVTDFQRKENAVAILRNELDGLSPISQLMKVSLASERPVIESIPEDVGLCRLWYSIRVEVNGAVYYREFAPRWARILDQVKTSPERRLALKNELPLIKAYAAVVEKKYGRKPKGKSGVMTRCEVVCEDRLHGLFSEAMYPGRAYPLSWTGLALNEEYGGMCFLSTIIDGRSYVLHGFKLGSYESMEGINIQSFRDAGRFVRRIFVRGEDENSVGPLASLPECGTFGVALVKKARGNVLSGSVYRVSRECVAEIVKWQNRFILGNSEPGYHCEKDLTRTTCVLSFLDAEGAEVVGTTFTVRNIDVLNLACVVLEGESRDYAGSRLWLLTPLVGGVAKSYVKWVSVDLPKDDVAAIATASISVEE